VQKPVNRIRGTESFAALAHEVATRLVHAQAEKLDEALQECLAMVGEYFDASAVALGAGMTTAGAILPGLHLWSAEPARHYIDAVQPGPELYAYVHRNGSIIWNCLEDLESLPQFQRHCRQVGIAAGIFWLYRDFGSHSQHLSIGKVHPKVWADDAVEQFGAVGEVLASAYYRRQAELEAERLRGIERVVSDVASSLVNACSERVSTEIDKALCQIGESTGADLCTFKCSDSGTAKTAIDIEWRGDSANEPLFCGVNLANDHPWLASRLLEGKRFSIANPDDIPEAAKAGFERIGVKSMTWTPFEAAHGRHGYLGLSTIKRTEQWSDDIVRQLNLAGTILANAIDRRSLDLALRQAFDEMRDLKDKISAENSVLRQEFDELPSDDSLVGRTHAFRTAVFQSDQVAATDSTVLLLGETGTGKGILARRIHEQSGRSDRPLITVNCAALPPTLIESELFGHEKGAFTGAINRKIGRFELADGGTIFLDEVGDLPIDLQAKMLRVLQDQEFERVGSSTTQTVDVRVISATNRDLDQLIEQGDFRADLYYRLGVFPIRVPPLRERRGDIPLLVWFFVSELEHRLGRTIETVSSRAMDALTSYNWPGNVRELRNIIERAMILSPGTTLELGNWFPDSSSRCQAPMGETIEEVERQHIEKILDECDWKIRGEGGAAEHLGLKRTTLQSRMKKLGIVRPIAYKS